jgi:hypothetical protein
MWNSLLACARGGRHQDQNGGNGRLYQKLSQSASVDRPPAAAARLGAGPLALAAEAAAPFCLPGAADQGRESVRRSAASAEALAGLAEPEPSALTV